MKEIETDGQILGRILGGIRRNKKSKDKKWTIAYVAEQAELDENFVEKFLREGKKEPQFVTIAKLAEALELSIDDLWEEYKKERYPSGE